MTDNKKRGRPKAINSRSKQYRIRLTDDECETLGSSQSTISNTLTNLTP